MSMGVGRPTFHCIKVMRNQQIPLPSPPPKKREGHANEWHKAIEHMRIDRWTLQLQLPMMGKGEEKFQFPLLAADQ